MKPSLKKELLRMVLIILITKESRASVRQVSHQYNNPEIILDFEVEVGLEGTLTVLSEHIQIVV